MVDIKIPEGYKLVKVVPKITIQQEIDTIELSLGEEPTDKELIEEGRMIHPYYHQKERLEELKKQLEG